MVKADQDLIRDYNARARDIAQISGVEPELMEIPQVGWLKSDILDKSLFQPPQKGHGHSHGGHGHSHSHGHAHGMHFTLILIYNI